MPRRDIEFIKGGIYHLYNRGPGKHNLFFEDYNYQYVICRMTTYSPSLKVTIIAYCLMPNHYHLLVRQDDEIPVAELPKRVFGGYSRAVNKRYGWSGTIFEGRYQAKMVSTSSHLCHLCRYIHANPVKDGLVDEIDEWPYSNYPEWVGKRKSALVNREFIDDLFGSSTNYEEFVREYMESQQESKELTYLEDF
jgi:REP element-mobilizing transposase RayT